MALKLSELLNYQDKLDKSVLSVESSKFDDYTILLAKKTALITEFFEFFNEAKLFKFWTNKKINLERLKEEYIDILHFALSLCISYKKEFLAEKCFLGVSSEEKKNNLFEESHFNLKLRVELLNISFDWMRDIYESIESENFSVLLGWIEKLSVWMALSGSEIKRRYLEKWKVNFQRLGIKVEI